MVCLPEMHFTASGFFLKIFGPFAVCVFRLCFFLVLFFFFFFFFCESTHYEKQKKQQHKNNNLQTGRTNTFLCLTFFLRLSHEKSVKSVLSKNLHQSVPSAQNESCLACK